MADGTISKIQLPDNTIYDVVDNTSGYMTGMTILSYGSSTWQNFIDAYSSNKVVYCRASSSSNPASGSQTRLAFMAYVNNATTPTEVEFQYYRSVSTHTASQQGDQVYVYKLNKTNGWSVTVREASVKVVAGTGLGGTYSNGTMTLTGPTKVSDLTNDSGFITLNDVPTTHSIPSGGTTGQVLTKDSGTNYDVSWVDPSTSAFIAEYGVTTYADVKDAYDEDAIILCVITRGTESLVLQLYDFLSTNQQFAFSTITALGMEYAILTTSGWTNGVIGLATTNTATTDDDGLMSYTDKQKLDGIASGAEVNVQSDWSQSTNTADDYIKNKPTIPTNTSDLTNDSGFITLTDVPEEVFVVTITYSNSEYSFDKTYAEITSAYNSGKHIVGHDTSWETYWYLYGVSQYGIEFRSLTNLSSAVSSYPSYIYVNSLYLDLTNQVEYTHYEVAVPTKTSHLTNDSGFITLTDVPKELFTVTFTYDDQNEIWSCNKTAQEIYEAHEAGKIITGVNFYNRYNLYLFKNCGRYETNGSYTYYAEFESISCSLQYGSISNDSFYIENNNVTNNFSDGTFVLESQEYGGGYYRIHQGYNDEDPIFIGYNVNGGGNTGISISDSYLSISASDFTSNNNGGNIEIFADNSISMYGNHIGIVSDSGWVPTSGTDFTTKAYVDSAISGVTTTAAQIIRWTEST